MGHPLAIGTHSPPKIPYFLQLQGSWESVVATSALLWPGGFGPRVLPPTLSSEIAPRVRHIDWTRFLRRVLDAEGLLEADEVVLLGGQRLPAVDFIYQLYECLMSMGSAKPTAAELHPCWVGQWAAVERDMEVCPPPFRVSGGGMRTCCQVGASLAAPASPPCHSSAPYLVAPAFSRAGAAPELHRGHYLGRVRGRC